MLFNEVDEFIRNFESTDKFDNADVNFEKFINFLKTSSVNCIPLIVDNYDNILITSLIVPKNDLPKNYIEDLKDNINSFQFHNCEGMYYYCEENQLIEPCDSYNPIFLKKSTPPFLNRDLPERGMEYDINQKIFYSLNMYKKGDCKFPTFYIGNKEVAKIIMENNIELCTINKEEVEKYLEISNSILIRYFHVRFIDNSAQDDPINHEIHRDEINMDTDKIYYEYTKAVDSESEKILDKEIRGFQLID